MSKALKVIDSHITDIEERLNTSFVKGSASARNSLINMKRKLQEIRDEVEEEEKPSEDVPLSQVDGALKEQKAKEDSSEEE